MRNILLFFFLSLTLFAEDITTSHLIELESGSFPYSAVLGALPVLDEKGEKKGEISYIAYLKDPLDEKRPVTFAFNGGPGSSSIWLHMGTFGPRRIRSPEEGQPVTPPYEILDNQETILDLTDIVFIDPISTGFSKASSPDDALAFYNIKDDIRSVGDFIRDYITEKRRWNSPKFIAGESYGTLRACGLAHYLQSEHGIYLNGLVLVSCAIDFGTLQLGSGEESLLSSLLYFPTYVTTAWYHGRYRTETSLRDVADEAKRFAYKEYAPWLLEPRSLSRSEREGFFEELSKMTGIELFHLKRANGRIDDGSFMLQFFQDEKKMLGRFDTRVVGDYPTSRYIADPSGLAIDGIFTGAFHEYLQKELGKAAYYLPFSIEANSNWDFSAERRFGSPNFMDELRNAMTSNPNLRVYVGSGYFDLATPFAATDYCFDHLDLPEKYTRNIQMEYYEGGHMYYLNPSERNKFKKDLERFYKEQ